MKTSNNSRDIWKKFKEHPVNYTSMKKDIETINKSQEEMKNTASEMKKIVEGIKSRLDEAEDPSVNWSTK